jgi:hypothetical protein
MKIETQFFISNRLERGLVRAGGTSAASKRFGFCFALEAIHV